MKKAHGDIIDFADSLIDGSGNMASMVPAYIQTKEKVEKIGVDMPDYIWTCLKKRGIEVDQEVIREIFILGGMDAVTYLGQH